MTEWFIQPHTDRADPFGIIPEPWMQEALCAQTDPDAFFPEKGGTTLPAKAICAGCEVRQQCLDYALRTGQTAGIWGGTSPRQRAKVRRAS